MGHWTVLSRAWSTFLQSQGWIPQVGSKDEIYCGQLEVINCDDIWLVVSTLPLWKMMEWVRQLGWWPSQYDGKNKIHVPNHQPDIFQYTPVTETKLNINEPSISLDPHIFQNITVPGFTYLGVSYSGHPDQQFFRGSQWPLVMATPAASGSLCLASGDGAADAASSSSSSGACSWDGMDRHPR